MSPSRWVLFHSCLRWIALASCCSCALTVDQALRRIPPTRPEPAESDIDAVLQQLLARLARNPGEVPGWGYQRTRSVVVYTNLVTPHALPTVMAAAPFVLLSKEQAEDIGNWHGYLPYLELTPYHVDATTIAVEVQVNEAGVEPGCFDVAPETYEYEYHYDPRDTGWRLVGPPSSVKPGVPPNRALQADGDSPRR